MNYQNLLERNKEAIKKHQRCSINTLSNKKIINSNGKAYIVEENERLLECSVCFEFKPESHFRCHNKEKNIRQWACMVCHAKIDKHNKKENKMGIKSDDWIGKFATKEARERSHNKGV